MEYMAEFVRDHARKLIIRHGTQDSGGQRDGGVLWIASGGKSIWRIVRNQPEFRHRDIHTLRQTRHDWVHARVDGRILLWRDGLGRVHGKSHSVGKKIAEEIHG